MMRADLDRLLDSKLTERESNVLRMRYGLRDGKPRTLADIGEVMSVTRERIRQIEVRAFEKLQKRMRELAADKGMVPAVN